jgi:hypothetical protein
LEWEALKQIETRLLDLEEEVYLMNRFCPQQRMKEIHEIHDTLCKISKGKLMDSDIGQEFISSFNSGFTGFREDDFISLDQISDDYEFECREKKKTRKKGGRAGTVV